MIYFLMDSRSPMISDVPQGFSPGHFEVFIQDHRATLAQVVQAVIEALSAHLLQVSNSGQTPVFRFAWMRIRAHGTPGRVQLGSGLNVSTVAPFAPLRNRFLHSAQPGQSPQPGQGIEIHSCNVAANEPVGPNFLMALATVTGQCVTGAVMQQYSDPRWGYEGPTVTAHPHDGFFHNLFSGPPGPPRPLGYGFGNFANFKQRVLISFA
jgi:hypothetical protein